MSFKFGDSINQEAKKIIPFPEQNLDRPESDQEHSDREEGKIINIEDYQNLSREQLMEEKLEKKAQAIREMIETKHKIRVDKIKGLISRTEGFFATAESSKHSNESIGQEKLTQLDTLRAMLDGTERESKTFVEMVDGSIALKNSDEIRQIIDNLGEGDKDGAFDQIEEMILGQLVAAEYKISDAYVKFEEQTNKIEDNLELLELRLSIQTF